MSFPSKSVISFSLIVLFTLSARAGEKRIYQTDLLGNIQYHKPSYTIKKEGRIIETDPMGNKQYHKQQYQIKDDKIYQINLYGNIQYHKPMFLIK